MQCLGAWDAENGRSEQYFVMLNEEADEYRCGVSNLFSIVHWSATFIVILSFGKWSDSCRLIERFIMHKSIGQQQ